MVGIVEVFENVITKYTPTENHLLHSTDNDSNTVAMCQIYQAH